MILNFKLFIENTTTLLGKLLSLDDIKTMNIPIEFYDELSKWDVIYKSPYSDTLYNTTDIGWNHKKNGSKRISDHWNFHTNRRIEPHCVTDKPVKNTTHVSLGVYDSMSGKYKILASHLSPKQILKLNNKKDRDAFFKIPKVIEFKKEFKKRVADGEIFIDVVMKDSTRYKGKIRKFTGTELKIEDPTGNLIYNNNYLGASDYTSIELVDKNGNSIVNPFDLDALKNILTFEKFIYRR